MLSKRLSNLHPYVPGEQPMDREYIKLNANENPYPPSPLAAQAVRNLMSGHPERLGLYPDPDATAVRQGIADMLNRTGGVLAHPELNALPFKVTPDMIFCGNGSDEVLSFVFYAFFDAEQALVLPEHTYSFYPVYAGFYSIPLDKIPLTKDWHIDTDTMLRHAARQNSAIILANPNAPTGIALSRAQIRAMLDAAPEDRVFVVDEAYADFGTESCIALLADYENLVIVRTFSKSLSFAGMRVGYAVARPELIGALFTVKNSFNHFPLDAAVQIAAAAACADTAYYTGCARKIIAERDSFHAFLQERGWNVIPSQTNFVFCEHPHVGGREIYSALKEHGILVRRFDTAGIENYLRITVGTKEQMGALKAALEHI